MDVVTKSVEATVKPIESEHPNGEFEIILSTEDLDRDGENLWIDEWKQPLPKRIQIDGDHARSIEKTVGSVVPRIEGNLLVGKGPFAGTPYAQTIRQIVTDKEAEGHGIGASVTYSERKTKDGKIQRELLNAALVAIPANPNAVFMSAKSAKVPSRNKAMYEVLKEHVGTEVAFKIAENTLTREEARAFFFDKAAGGLSASGDNPEVKHDAMVQAIHDAAYALGAECTNAAEADPGTDEGANKSANEETSSTKDAGSPQETEESTATAEKAAAAEESAEDAALTKAKEAEKARALAWLISQNTKD